MSEKLEPCPFCGACEVENDPYAGVAMMRVEERDMADDLSYVYCHSCGTEGPGEPTETEARKKWNRRAIPSAPPREPTPEMIHQATIQFVRENGGMEASVAGIWRAMFDAAPSQQQTAPQIGPAKSPAVAHAADDWDTTDGSEAQDKRRHLTGAGAISTGALVKILEDMASQFTDRSREAIFIRMAAHSLSALTEAGKEG